MKKILILVGALATAACAPMPHTAAVSEPDSAYALILAGYSAYDRWEKSSDASALPEAEQYLRQALATSPDNVRLQYYYYQTLYALAARDWQRWHRQLEEDFVTVNPLVKTELTPPAFLQQLHLPEHASLDEREQLLKRAVAQQPDSPQSWYMLSVVYKDQRQFQLALDAALRAATRNDKHALLAYQVGSLYDDLSYLQHCPYPPARDARESIRYLAAAIALDSENDKYHAHLAQVYSRVGLGPLALNEAQRAFALSASDVNRETLARALLDVGNIAEAQRHYQLLRAGTEPRLAEEALAVIYASRGEWGAAQRAQAASVDPRQPNLYEIIIQQWLAAIARVPTELHPGDAGMLSDPWQKRIAGYIDDGDSTDLITAAVDDCQSTEAYFYTAMRAWLRGEHATSEKYLQHVVQLGVYNYVEFQWARAMLQSDLFD